MNFRSPRAGLLLACTLAAVLRLPSFLYGVISDDEAIYDAMARTLAHGGVMYREAVDHKPPGLAYTYALFQMLAHGNGALSMALVHLCGLLAVVLTCVALFQIARRVLPEEQQIWPPLLYAVFSACMQPADALAVNGELLMNLPVALCIVCALEAGLRRSKWRALLLDLLAGALGTAAALYKYQAAVVLFALPALWLSQVPAPLAAGSRERFGRAVTTVLRRGIPAVAGSLLGVAAVAEYFQAHGALRDAIGWGINFNRNYIAEGSPPLWALERFGAQFLGVVLPGALLYGAGLLTVARLLRRRSGDARTGRPQEGGDIVAARAFLALWTLFSLASVTLGLRFFGHYFLQAELPLALLAAGPVHRLFAARPRLTTSALAIPALAFFLIAALPSLTQPILNARDPDTRGIGQAIEARTRPADTIWVWGNVPQLYYASSRSPGVRFTFCNYLTGLSPGTPSEYDDAKDPRAHAVSAAWSLVLSDLELRRPTLVLDTAAARIKSYGKFPIASYPLLAGYLAQHYKAEGAIEGVIVYRRSD